MWNTYPDFVCSECHYSYSITIHHALKLASSACGRKEPDAYLRMEWSKLPSPCASGVITADVADAISSLNCTRWSDIPVLAGVDDLD